MSELGDAYESLVERAYPNYIRVAELTREQRLARGAEYIAKALPSKFAPDFHVGQEADRHDQATGPYKVFEPSHIGWRLRKGRGEVGNLRFGSLDMTLAAVAMLTVDGKVLRVAYDPVITEAARDAGNIKAIPPGDVAMTTDVVDLLAPGAELDAVTVFDGHAQRRPYGLQQITYDLAELAFRRGVPLGM